MRHLKSLRDYIAVLSEIGESITVTTPTGISDPDLAKSSEVEVTFRQDDGGLATVVELEHRGLERHIVSRVETIASSIKGRARRAQCNSPSRASLM